MEIKQLKAFIAAARQKSFLKAANNLFVSRQALSKTIVQLENELGIELFVRSSKGARLTAAGEYLLPRAEALVNEMEKLKNETIGIARTSLTTVRIVLSSGLFGLYAEKLHRYFDAHADELQLQLRSCLEADCEGMLKDGKADAVISYSRLSGDLFSSSVISVSPLAFLINKSNPSIDLVRGNPEALTALPKLLYTGGRERGLWWKDFPGRNDNICSDLDYTFRMLQMDRGIMPVPKDVIPSYLDYAEAYYPSSMQEWVPVYFTVPKYEAVNPSLAGIMEEIHAELIVRES